VKRVKLRLFAHARAPCKSLFKQVVRTDFLPDAINFSGGVCEISDFYRDDCSMHVYPVVI
jgi:hypothetical protein